MKSNMKFKNHYNAGTFSPGVTVIDKTIPSATVPDQSMTINEIYQRYASGRSLSGVASPVYDDDGSGKIQLDFDDYMPDIATLDLADRQHVLEHAKLELDEVKKRLDGVAKAKKLAQSKREKELQDRIAELESKATPEAKPGQ